MQEYAYLLKKSWRKIEYVKFIYCSNPDTYEGLEPGGRHLPAIWALIPGLKKTKGYARE
jgi:hypothetical protein